MPRRCCNRWPRPAPCPFFPRTFPSAAPFGSSARMIVHDTSGSSTWVLCSKITRRRSPLNLDFPNEGWVTRDSSLFPLGHDAGETAVLSGHPAEETGSWTANRKRLTSVPGSWKLELTCENLAWLAVAIWSHSENLGVSRIPGRFTWTRCLLEQHRRPRGLRFSARSSRRTRWPRQGSWSSSGCWSGCR